MLSLYIGCAVVGMVLVVLASLHGFHGHDDLGSGDADGHDHDGSEALWWLPIFSMRFWTFFAAGFGLSGTTMTLLKSATSPAILAWSIGTGFVAGWLVSMALRLARKGQSGSAPGMSDFAGKEAHVIVASQGIQPGKIRLSLHGETIDVLASHQNGAPLIVGEPVYIVEFEREIAQVLDRKALTEDSSG